MSSRHAIAALSSLPDAIVHGRIMAPEGTLWLKQGTTAVGTFVGKRVRVEPHASVSKDGG